MEELAELLLAELVGEASEDLVAASDDISEQIFASEFKDPVSA